MKGIKTGGRQKGTPNKLTKQVREKLEQLVSNLIDEINIDNANDEQKFKLLQLGLQYVLPKLRDDNITKEEPFAERPIFKEIDLNVPEEQPQIDMSE